MKFHLGNLCVLFALAPLLQPMMAQAPEVRIRSEGIPRHLLSPEQLPAKVLSTDEVATIARCREDLKSGESETRAGAIMILSKYDHPSARQPIIDALADPSARVRRAALVSVAEWSRNAPLKAVEPVIRLLGDDDVEIRRTASGSLATMLSIRQTYQMIRALPGTQKAFSDELKPIIANAFEDEDALVRRNMVSNLGGLDISLPERTWAALLQDPERPVRLAVLPLAARQAPRAVFWEAARQIAEADDPAERLQLACELYYQGGQPEATAILEQLKSDTDPKVATEALLAQLSQGHSESLAREGISRLLQGEVSQDQGMRLLRLLRVTNSIPPAYLESLIELPSPLWRREAVSAYLDSGLASGKPDKLQQFAEDSSAEVRAALWQYLRYHPAELTPVLSETIIFSNYEDARSQLVEITYDLPKAKAGTTLNELLLDESTEIRAKALMALVEQQLSGWQGALSATMLDPDNSMQRLALSLTFEYPHAATQESLTAYLQAYPESPLAPLVRRRLAQIEQEGGDT